MNMVQINEAVPFLREAVVKRLRGGITGNRDDTGDVDEDSLNLLQNICIKIV